MKLSRPLSWFLLAFGVWSWVIWVTFVKNLWKDGSGLAFDDVVGAALADTGTLVVKGTWSTPPETQGGKFRGAAVGSTAGFSYAAQVVEVAVDEETGVVSIEHVWVAHDCGFAINPLAVTGQVQGAVWMGMGQALQEETQYHEGLHLRPNFLDYRVPTIAESPPIVRGLTSQLTRSSTAMTATRSNERRSRITAAPPSAASASLVRPPTISPIEPD